MNAFKIPIVDRYSKGKYHRWKGCSSYGSCEQHQFIVVMRMLEAATETEEYGIQSEMS